MSRISSITGGFAGYSTVSRRLTQIQGGFLTWTTTAGSIGDFYEQSSVNISLSVNSSSTTTFTLDSGTLPSGLSLGSSGQITGTLGAITGVVQSDFVVRASNTDGNTSTRSFSITGRADAVTWTTVPSYFYITCNVAIPNSNVVFNATSSSGRPVTITADVLPDGTSITGNQLTGTPTLSQVFNCTFTATESNSGKSVSALVQIDADLIGESIYISGAQTWICPPGVTKVHAVVIGGGGAGLRSTSGGAGGRGGSLRYKNNIPVTAGVGYSLNTGSGGYGATTSQNSSQDGTSSWFINTSTLSAQGGGGGGRSGLATRAMTGVNAGDGGGDGGTVTQSNSATLAGGGGGAGGYSGNGGNGAFGNVSGGAGSGGGGGGGGGSGSTGKGGSGGGTGAFGAGASGTGGAGTSTSNLAGHGTGGSKVDVNHPNYASLGGTDGGTLIPQTNGYGGGNCGGGGGGCDSSATTFPNDGGWGVVRIIWGLNRSFPSTNAGIL
jgi:hypothetical protein